MTGTITHLAPAVVKRWVVSVIGSTVLTGGAMLVYPGGTQLDPTTRGYSITQNFLSDLGTTVAFDGRSNAIGALCFVSALALLLAGALGLLNAVRRLHDGVPRARHWSRAAIAVGIAVCVAFAGVALTPEDRDMALHVRFTVLAFRLVPLVALLLAGAAFADTRLPRTVGVGWLVLSVVLIAYVVELQFAPSTASLRGLTTQVIAQKLVVVSAVAVLLAQSVLLSRRSGVPDTTVHPV